MNRDLEFWNLVRRRLEGDGQVMLLVVADSSGSSPGRQGYKMIVCRDGELAGSIGGGAMEVNLVEQSRVVLDAVTRGRGDAETTLSELVHQRNAPNASGMICSGRQTVIFKLLTSTDVETVDAIIDSLIKRQRDILTVSPLEFSIRPPEAGTQSSFEKRSETDFRYTEQIGLENDLHIIGGGHCALALSELMSKMDFHISLYDDRPFLNTIEKNLYAHEIKIVDSYDRISDHISSGRSAYVVVMTLGYKTDETVIRGLIDKEFKYFGVLGSKAKMSALFKSLQKDGISPSKLSTIRTPVGLPINSRTPEEIAVSIAAEIISVKNAE